MKSSTLLPLVGLFCALLGPGLRAETLAERSLAEILERQRAVLAQAEKEGEDLDEGRFRAEVTALVGSYDVLIQKSPDFVLGYVAYADLLGRVSMTRAAVSMLFKANQLDPNQPKVKSQIAKFLAEDGKPLEALPWVMAAIKLAPKESRYHFNLGLLLATNRDEYIKGGEFTRAAIDQALLEAFQRAAALAPDDLALAYRAAEAYYDLEQPRWDEAVQAWSALEDRVAAGVEKETIRLHAANVLIKQGRKDHARAVLAGVTDPRLAQQKQTLLDQLAGGGD